MNLKRLQQIDQLVMQKISQSRNQHVVTQLAKFVFGHMRR